MRFLVSTILTLALFILLQLSLTTLTEAEHLSHVILTQEGAASPSTNRENSREALIRDYISTYPFISPLSNTHTAPQTSTVSIIYEQEIESKTVSAETFAVHAMQTGLLRQSFSVLGGEIQLTPSQAFNAGELVQVSATTGTLSVNNTAPEQSTIWQFWSAVSNGSGIFIESKGDLGDLSARSIALGDLNNDGHLDAFVVNNGLNAIWLNNGKGEFIQSAQELENVLSTDVALGDLDGDGDLDAFVTNSDQPNEVWLNNGQGFFIFSHDLTSHYSKAVALGDVDGDGDLDAFVANGEHEPNSLFINLGGVQNEEPGQFIDSGQALGESYSTAVALGDLDGDHDLDALIANYETTTEVWLNQGNAQGGESGFFTNSLQSLGGFYGRAVALGDVDSDGDLDAFLANQSNQPNELWLNDGKATFTNSGQKIGHTNSFDIALGDLDADNDLDAFVANRNRNQPNKVWLNQGGIQDGVEGVFTDSGQSLGHQGSFAVALGDLNGSGGLDAFVSNHESDQIWFNAEFKKQADLSISKRGPATAISGEPITYTLIITNSGDASATNLLITDYFPDDSTYVSGGDSFDGEKVNWFVPELAASSYMTKQFVVTSTAQSIINSDYSVIADDGISVQGKEKVVTLLIGEKSLEISKRAPLTATAGTPITYTLIITNSSDFSTDNLLITDRLPTHATYITGGDDFSDNIVSWTIGEMGANSTIRRQFIVTATQTITNHDYGVRGNHGESVAGTSVVVTHISPPSIPTRFIEDQISLVGNRSEIELLVSNFNNLQEGGRLTITQSASNTLISGLYHITNKATVASMIVSITTQAVISDLTVTPEANYLLAGGQYYVNGSPNAPPIQNIPSETFNSQWIDDPLLGIDFSSNGYTGDGIPVGVFDTSTFTDSIRATPYLKQENLLDDKVLNVWHLTNTLPISGEVRIDGHGYSVVSLIHHLAPEASLHLFRVLNNSGLGDLFALNQAIATFIDQHSGPGVINLSLGVLVDPEEVLQLYSLEQVLLKAKQKGFVIVAAAGNFSSTEQNGNQYVAPTQYPAAFPFVLSVASNNANRERSCFSSTTEGVSAPGGEGDVGCHPPEEYNPSNPTQYIIGLDPTSEKTGASAWTGSSFATPLASGLAALLLQKGEQDEGITPDGVINAIEKGAITVDDPDLGAGIINIPNSLSLIPGGGPIYRHYFPLLLVEE